MNNNKFCTTCNIKLDKTITRKTERFVKTVTVKKRKNDNYTIAQNQQRKINKVNINKNNRATLLVRPNFLDKSYFKLTKLSPIPTDRVVYIITKSPPDQYSNSTIKNKETSDEIIPLNENENGIKVFDDI